MNPPDNQAISPRRTFLMAQISACLELGLGVKGLEFSAEDELMLFEFLCPTTLTRKRGFTLCGLPVKWHVDFSAIVTSSGKRRRFSLLLMLDFGFFSVEDIRKGLAMQPPAREKHFADLRLLAHLQDRASRSTGLSI